jgi:hypothetical protein
MAASARVVTMASDVSTNLLKLKASRKKPRSGDVSDTECRRGTQWIYIPSRRRRRLRAMRRFRERPSVSLGAFPFLPEVVSGNVSSVTVQANGPVGEGKLPIEGRRLVVRTNQGGQEFEARASVSKRRLLLTPVLGSLPELSIENSPGSSPGSRIGKYVSKGIPRCSRSLSAM